MAVAAQLLDRGERELAARHRDEALTLARRLPSLVVAARDLAASATHGVHGRRQAGAGETFWQFRPFVAGEAASRIDWRRSAREDRHYVREREWESAHTVWLWMDRSPSMAFASTLARQSKLDRAVVLGLAAADLLVRGGERVGLLGLTPPWATRAIIERLAEALHGQERAGVPADGLPPAQALAPRTRAVLIGDFLCDPKAFADRIAALAARGARGHVLILADPVEETFPFAGHTEFRAVDSGTRLRLGRAEDVREVYTARLAAHREALAAAARARRWTTGLHRTDRPASQALLALRVQLETAGAEPV